MGKLAPTSIKYIIKAGIKAKGVIEKPDVIGAVFGQTEGLLGEDLDLRELQKTGRIGRIEVSIKSEGGNSTGEITIPSSLDSTETAMIAAALETIERVGPCTAEIELLGVEDIRTEKRDYVKDRAKDILKKMMKSDSPETQEVSDEIKESLRTGQISTYRGMTCGPEIQKAEELIIVEGRADVVNLLKAGVNNVIAIGGTSVPDALAGLAKGKKVSLFVDGDRGGVLIAKELCQKISVDSIAVAPDGKEVEELTQKELLKSLRVKMKPEYFLKTDRRPSRRPRESRRDSRSRERRPSGRDRREYSSRDRPARVFRLTIAQKDLFNKTLDKLKGSKSACIYNEKGEMLGKVPVKELPDTLKTMEDTHTVIFDGKITPDLTETAFRTKVRFLVGTDKDERIRSAVKTISKKDL